MRSFVAFGLALGLVTAVGCNKRGPAPGPDETPTTAAGASNSPPPPQAMGDGTEPYELDTEALPPPPANSQLARILKGLHIRVCVRGDVPSMGSFSSSSLEGLEIELATAIVREIGVDYKQPLKVEWVVVSAGDRIKHVQDDACDFLLASLSSTPERAGQVALSKVYLRTDKVLMAAAKVARKVPVIARLGGATGGEIPGIKGTERLFSSYQEVSYAMDNDEIDYLVTDRPIAAHLVRSSVKPYAISKTLSAGTESYVAATAKAAPELTTEVNRALDKIARSGHLALMYKHWL